MRFLGRAAVPFTAAAVFVSSTALAQNMVANPGFSNAAMLSGWTPGGSSSPTWSATDRSMLAGSGSGNAAVTIGTSSSGNSTLTQCVDGPTPASMYNVSAYMKATLAGCPDNGPFFRPDVSVTLFWWTGSGCTGGTVPAASLSLSLPADADGNWHLKAFSNLTPFMGTLSAQMVLSSSCSTDFMSLGSVSGFFDDLALQCAGTDGAGPLVTAPAGATVTQTVCQ
jgi:hypothetical protein